MNNALWLAESEPLSLQLQANFLGKSGYQLKSLTNAEGLNAALAAGAAPDLLIIGTLADGKSMSVLRQLRQQGLEFPIFMMSSSSDPIDQIMALEVGADDFLIKPVNPRVLLARIQACLRRLHRPAKVTAPERYRFGPFVLDLTERTLEKGKKPVQPLERQELAMMVMGRRLADNDRSLDVQVARLRKIIEEEPNQPRFLQTVWGSGYVFTPGK